MYTLQVLYRPATVSRHRAVPYNPKSPVCPAIPLQICTFVFNNFHDAPPATLFFSNFCIFARGWHGSPHFLFSVFHFLPPLTPLECALPRSRTLSALECAVTKTRRCKSFRMRSSEKRWGGGHASPIFPISIFEFPASGQTTPRFSERRKGRDTAGGNFSSWRDGAWTRL